MQLMSLQFFLCLEEGSEKHATASFELQRMPHYGPEMQVLDTVLGSRQ
jgi:hypothetical protein